MKRSISAEGTAGIARIDSDPPPPGDEGPYDAPTKVGPMSAVAIAKLMHEAEAASVKDDAAPMSGVRPSSPCVTSDESSGPPVLNFDEEQLEPTRVSHVDPPSEFETASEAVKGSANVVNAIVNEMVTLDDADLEADAPSTPPPLPPRASRASSVPPSRWQPRPAAFPEWVIGAAARATEPVASGHRKPVLLAAAGGCVALVTLLVWWICSAL